MLRNHKVSPVFVVVGTAFIALSLPVLGDAVHPKIPLIGATKDDFVPNEEWQVMSSSAGDLNGDKKADAAIVLAKVDEPGPDSENPASPRCLVIATRGADGKLHRVLQDWEIIPEANSGGAGVGEALQNLEIKKGLLNLVTYFGSNERSQYTYDYRLQGNRLRPVKLDYMEFNSSEGKGAHIFVDPAVGFATASNDTLGYEDDAKIYRKKPATHRFYIITVEPVKALTMQAAHSIRLAALTDVTQCKPLWKGPADLSARIRAVYSGKKVSITAEVTDDVVTAGDTMRLLNEKGKVIAPVSSVKKNVDKGYTQTCEYNLSSLSALPPADVKYAPTTVEVIDFDVDLPMHCAMSTTRGGLKYPGQLAFCDEIEMGVLQSILESKNMY